MSLEDTISRIQKNMQHSSFVGNIMGDNRFIIPRFLSVAERDFAALENGEEVVLTEDDKKIVVRVLDLCKMILLEVPITDELKELVSDVCILLFNWNNNTENDNAIAHDIRFIRNTIDMHFTLISLVTFTKAVVREATKKKVISSVRTDEISNHFLSAIDALNEEKERDCGNNKEGFCSKP